MRLLNLKTFILLTVIFLSQACVTPTPTEQAVVTPTTDTPPQATPTTELQQEKHLIIHHDGKITKYEGHLPEVVIIFDFVEDLLATADTTYRLIVTEDVIEEVRQGHTVELVFDDIQESIISFNQQPIKYIRLLISLSGSFSDGTIFINGAYTRQLSIETPGIEDLSDNWEVVINTEGTSQLMNLLEALPSWDK